MNLDLIQWLRTQSGQADLDVTLTNLDRLVASDKREWLITNGRGTYGGGSISGANSSKYHGLLVASLDAPVARTVLLSRIDERVNGEPLATNLWASGNVSPEGYKKLVAFTVTPVPTWVYRLKDGVLIKQVAMLAGKQEVAIGYTWLSDAGTPAEVEADLIVNARDFHTETRSDGGLTFDVQDDCAGIVVKPSWLKQSLRIRSSSGSFQADPVWYKSYYWPREYERGLNSSEDCFRIGRMKATLQPGASLTLVASVQEDSVNAVPAGQRTDTACDIIKIVREVVEHQQKLLVQAGSPADTHVRRLVLAADAYLVWRDSTASNTIIAGYHWFNDWGRDSMISLPGLTLSTGRTAVAKGIIKTFLKYLSEGMLPNNFPDRGQSPAYNTSDATFWLGWALLRYYQKTSDLDFVKECLPQLVSIVDWHEKGTRYNLKLDPSDGLITGGADGVQLTWMDAIVDGFVVTPRRGKAVEISALWFNFLKALAALHEACSLDASRFEKLAEQTRKGFAAFWNEDKSCLYDVIRADGTKDGSVRPNQVFALSLPYALLPFERARSVLWVVEAELLTPMGLRSLSPYDPDYKGRYGLGKASANQYDRDITYHQGTVWGWLIGPWVDARLRVYGRTEDNFRFIANRLKPLKEHLLNGGAVGQISEIFDGDPAHDYCGCVAQAWSVAELLRVLTDNPSLQQ